MLNFQIESWKNLGNTFIEQVTLEVLLHLINFKFYRHNSDTV